MSYAIFECGCTQNLLGQEPSRHCHWHGGPMCAVVHETIEAEQEKLTARLARARAALERIREAPMIDGRWCQDVAKEALADLDGGAREKETTT